MFEAVLEDGWVLRKVVEAIYELQPEANLQCDSEGIHIQTMDDTHVSLIVVELGVRMFEHYRCDAPVVLGLRFQTLLNALKEHPKNCRLTIRKHEDEQQLTLSTEHHDNANGYGRTVVIKLSDIDQDRLKLPPQEYNVMSSFPSKTLQAIFRDLGSVGEHVTLTVTDRYFRFVHDEESSQLYRVFDNHGGTTWRLTGDEFKAEYGLRYLTLFAKATPLCDKAQLNVSEGVPLMLTYPLGVDSGVHFYLAPKVD